MHADQRLATAVFQGALTPDLASAIARATAAHVMEVGAHAGIADYRSALPTVPGAELRRSVRAATRQAKSHGVPMALVVRDDDLEAWKAHAFSLCASGLLRAAFSDMEQARRWAAEMAALRQAQARFLSRGR